MIGRLHPAHSSAFTSPAVVPAADAAVAGETVRVDVAASADVAVGDFAVISVGDFSAASDNQHDLTEINLVQRRFTSNK